MACLQSVAGLKNGKLCSKIFTPFGKYRQLVLLSVHSLSKRMGDSRDSEHEHGLDEALLIRFMKNCFHDRKPVDVLDISVDWAVPKGENFASRVYRVKLLCISASGKKQTVSMIVKAQLLSQGHHELFSAAVPVFRTEIKTYSTVLRLLEDLQHEFADGREPLWAQMLGFELYNMVALEDLQSLQYMVAERRNCLDFNHSVLVLRNIARFHAMSKVLLSRNLLSHEDVKIIRMGARDEIAEAWLTANLIRLSDAMCKTWGREWSEIAARLRQQIPVVTDKFADLAGQYDKRFEVFNHGDLWTCNVLFRYMEFENIPISARFVDFQMCHLNSFVWDLEYFIASSVLPSVRRSVKHRLYEAYQESLEKNLKFFHFKGYVPTLEDVKSEAKRIEYVAAILTAQSPITYAETNKAVSTDKIIGYPASEIIHECVYGDGKAEAFIGDDLKEFVSKGLI